jgi:hypothetical protein
MSSRIFKTVDGEDKEVVLKFTRPNQKILTQAELVYRTAFSRAFRQDVLTTAEVKEALKRRGLWGEEQEAAVRALRVKTRDLEDRLREEGPTMSDEAGYKLCSEISKLRAETSELNSIHQTVTMNTCESIAEEEKNKHLTVSCVTHSVSGEKVYKEVEDFNSKLDTVMAINAFSETLVGMMEVQLGQSLSSNISDEYVENEWIADRVAKAEVEAEAEASEESESDAETEPVKKKRGRRKKTS